jgi:hypothetical protein
VFTARYELGLQMKRSALRLLKVNLQAPVVQSMTRCVTVSITVSSFEQNAMWETPTEACTFKPGDLLPYLRVLVVSPQVTCAKPPNFRLFPIHHPPIFWPFELPLTKGQAAMIHYLLPQNTKLQCDNRNKRTNVYYPGHIHKSDSLLHTKFWRISLNSPSDFFSSFVTLKIHSRLLLAIHTVDRASKIASSVGIATRYGLGGLGIESRLGRGFPHPSRLALEPNQPPIQSEQKVFPWLQTFSTRKLLYVEYKRIF